MSEFDLSHFLAVGEGELSPRKPAISWSWELFIQDMLDHPNPRAFMQDMLSYPSWGWVTHDGSQGWMGLSCAIPITQEFQGQGTGNSLR